MRDEGGSPVPVLLLLLLALLPLVPNPDLFTSFDLPKWAVLGALVLAALLITFARALRSGEATKIHLPEHLALLAVLVPVAMVFAEKAPDARVTLRAWAFVGTLTALGVLASRYLRDGNPAERVFLVAVGAGAGVAVVGLVGHAAGILWGAASTIGNSSFAAEYVAPALLLAAALFTMGRRTFAIVAGVLMLAFLGVAKSRADWLGLGVGVAVLVLVEVAHRRGWKLRPRLLTGLLLAGILALPFAIEVLPVPAFGRSDTLRVRDLTRRGTLDMALDHPVSGVGLDGFAAAYPEYRDAEEFRLSLRRDVGFAHNLPLSVFAECGAPGLAVLLFFLWVTLSSGVRTVLKTPEDGIAFGGLGAVVAVLVSAQLSAPLRHPASAALFFVLSGILVARRPRRYVADLVGRYRRMLPVLILLTGPVALAALLPPKLLADFHLKSAVDNLASEGVMTDTGFADRLRRSLDAEPDPRALHMLADYHLTRDEPEVAPARELVDRLLALSPHHPQGRMEQARLLLLEGRSDEAEEILDDLTAKRPGDPFVAMRAGRAKIDREKWEEAEAILGPACEAEPANGILMLLRARALSELGRLYEAARVLDPLARDILRGRLPPPRRLAEFHSIRADTLFAAMKEAPVTRVPGYARELSELYPERVVAVVRMGERLGYTDRDRGLAILANLGSDEAAFSLALVYAHHGELDRAMTMLREAVSLGSATKDRLLHHPGLDPLRLRADFKALLR